MGRILEIFLETKVLPVLIRIIRPGEGGNPVKTVPIIYQKTENPETEDLRVRTMSNIFLVFTGLLFAIFASCSGKEVYSRFHHLEGGKWCRDSVLVFTMDSLEYSSDAEYMVTVELTTNRSYPYRDLWLIIDQNLTDSLVCTDTLRLLLADEHGKWLGGGVGGLNQLSLPYRSFIPTPRDSMHHYRLTIRHGMDEELLRGVEKVGIKM
jgi:gliding motility-associated lipoprotein GldH